MDGDAMEDMDVAGDMDVDMDAGMDADVDVVDAGGE